MPELTHHVLEELVKCQKSDKNQIDSRFLNFNCKNKLAFLRNVRNCIPNIMNKTEKNYLLNKLERSKRILQFRSRFHSISTF
jgi:hypothetical protein